MGICVRSFQPSDQVKLLIGPLMFPRLENMESAALNPRTL